MQPRSRVRSIWWWLAAVPAAGLLLAVIGLAIVGYRARSQAAIVGRLEREGARVSHRPISAYGGLVPRRLGDSVPFDWRERLGNDLFLDVDTVVALNSESEVAEPRRYSREQLAKICKLSAQLPRLRAFWVRSDAFEFREIASWPQLREFRELSINSAQLTDADLAEIGGCQSLRVVGVASPAVTDQGIRELARLTDLWELRITCPQVTDAGIVSLPPLPNLDSLWLSEAPLTDRSIGHFSTSPHLSVVDLSGTVVTDAGLQRLVATAPQLIRLQLGRTAITDRGLAALPSERLRGLDLQGTAVTDAGLVNLGQLTELRWLNLSQTAVAGEEARHLLPCEFHDLDLSGTPLTRQGLAEIVKLRVENLNLQKTPLNDETLLLFNEATKIGTIDVRGTSVTVDGVRNYETRREKAWTQPGAMSAGVGGPSIRCDFRWEDYRPNRENEEPSENVP